MAKYFSASKVAFYDDVVTPLGLLPEDALLMSDDDYEAIMAKQNEGFVIVAGSDGYPAVIKQTRAECSALVHDLLVATPEVLGHVKIGKNINVGGDGSISVELFNDVGAMRNRDTSKPNYGLT